MRTLSKCASAVALVVGLCIAGVTHAQHVVVDGNMWLKS